MKTNAWRDLFDAVVMIVVVMIAIFESDDVAVFVELLLLLLLSAVVGVNNELRSLRREQHQRHVESLLQHRRGLGVVDR